MEREQRQRHEPAQERVRNEQVEQAPGERAVARDRYAPDEVRERNAPEQRRHGARDGQQRVPPAAPARVLALVAVLDRDPADDQTDEQDEQRNVEGREECRVPRGERSEGRPTGHDQPYLVPVPDGADRVHERATLLFVVADETLQNADPEVEALEDEVADPEDRDQEEPEGLQVPVAVGCGGSEHQ